MKVVIINGSAKTGKDQFARIFKKHYDHLSVNWSTIDKVKKIAKRNFGWDGKKTDKSRKFLSDIKKLWSEYNNGPFEDMDKKISDHYYEIGKERKYVVYFIHCREPHEIQKFVDKFQESCITILLKRDDREVPNNDSDKNVENYKYDYYFDNNGNKGRLEKEVLKFIENIRK